MVGAPGTGYLDLVDMPAGVAGRNGNTDLTVLLHPTDARTVEVRLGLAEEGRVALMRRTNMQVQVAIRP